MSETMKVVAKDAPVKLAWEAFKQTEDFANTRRWALDREHIDGSLWHVFVMGFTAATERAGNLHENINPASDSERQDGSPGAGAMGAVIEYRDEIRRV